MFLILAAGKGTRMRSPVAKVLHPLGGKPMLRVLLDHLAGFRDMRTVCVVGHDADQVRSILPPGVDSVLQWPPRGTGDAVRVARSKWAAAAELVIAPGDAPLVSPETFRNLLAFHRRQRALATVLTAEPADPASYGRVVQDLDGRVIRIIEAVDADEETLRIRRINTGIYVFDPKSLLSVISRIGTSNRKGEFYLTDAIELLSKRGRVAALNTDDPAEVAGVNDQADLARLEGAMQKRLRGRLLAAGVQMPHPQSVYLEAGVKVAAGARLLPGTHLMGKTRVDRGAVIGPDTTIVDSRIGARTRVWYSVVERSVVGADSVIGPFAHLRPNSRVGRNVKIGNFVETKASRIDRGARVSHLTYLGDATVGQDSNVGAGTITCNYDGFNKYRTRIAARAFIGSNTALVAPVQIGAGAVIGAGSVITKPVPADSLALTRSPQIVKRGWAKRKREMLRRKTRARGKK